MAGCGAGRAHVWVWDVCYARWVVSAEVSADGWCQHLSHFFSGTYSPKERQRSFAEIERTLAKRKNAREASQSHRRTRWNHDDVAIVNYLVQKWWWCIRDRDIVKYLSFTASRSHRRNAREPSQSSKNTIESRWRRVREKPVQKWSWYDRDSVLMMFLTSLWPRNICSEQTATSFVIFSKPSHVNAWWRSDLSFFFAIM